MSDLVTFEKQGNVGVITVNNPPVNALSQGVRQGLTEAIAKGAADPAVTAMVVIGGGRTFIAGADIREFGKPPQPPDLHSVLAAIEGSAKPVVAAIHGTALGGGLEVCLACHYRVAVAAGQVGLPEVKLGLLPGAGGTQRLPRVAGVEAALKMIVSGDPVRAPKAKEMGIVDEIVGDDLRAGAVAFAERVVAEKRPLKKISDMDDKLAPARANPGVFDAFRKSIEREARGYLAPFKCIEAVQAAVTLPFAEGLKRERALFQECMASPQSKGQIHAFFAEREATKIPDVPPGTPAKKIERAAIVGAGTMGGGIAMNFANAGIPVTVVEVAQDALDRGLAVVRKNYAATVEKGRLSQADMDKRMGLITGSLDRDVVREADIVIEAVFEEMGVKKEVFAALDKIAKPGAVLASNTSTLDIDQIASATSRPGDVIGTHFFSPANVMRLLELVRGAKTSKETIATSAELARRHRQGLGAGRQLRRLYRQSHDPPVSPRGGVPRGRGRDAPAGGQGHLRFRLRHGPLRHAGPGGARCRLADPQGQGRHATEGPALLAGGRQALREGRFGQKTGAGWYRYEPGSRAPQPDPEVEAVIAACAKDGGIARRTVGDDEVLARCLWALVNEGARILEEGIALRSSDIDVTYLYGYGFPRYRGGPMFYADQVGLKKVYADVAAFHTSHGEPWAPAPLLERLAKEGKGFRDFRTS